MVRMLEEVLPLSVSGALTACSRVCCSLLAGLSARVLPLSCVHVARVILPQRPIPDQSRDSLSCDAALLVAGLGKSFQTIALLWLYFTKK